jgi:hydroxymethylbilane synthase
MLYLQILEAEEMLYAVGQGALAVECREDDFATLRLLEPLSHGRTTLRVLAERSFLRTLGGGCSAPVAVKSELNGQDLSLTGAVWSLDGKKILKHTSSCRLQYREEDDDGEPPR